MLLDNENYTKCPLYRRLQRDIERYIVRTIFEMRRRGEIRDQSVVAILHNLRQGQCRPAGPGHAGIAGIVSFSRNEAGAPP